MNNFQVKINLSGFKKDIEEFESRAVRVSVDATAKVRKPDFKRGKKSLNFAHGKQALYVRRCKQPKLRMTQLALILDKHYGVFSNASLKFADEDLQNVIDALIATFGQPVYSQQQKRIENACLALVTNPIMNKKFESNSPAWIKRKGFDWTMVSTGSFLRSITASMINV
ncbi:hypothetical protein P7245_22385 [Vibrio parahaemolyticus]|nr:hypothetical protein [Vibrio parahaemolyticus]